MLETIFKHVAPAPAVGAFVLFATWRWRRRTWPFAVAAGLGWTVSVVLVLGGLPDPAPKAAEEWLLAVGALALVAGTAESAIPRLPLPARLVLRAAAATAAAWMILHTKPEPPWEGASGAAVWYAVTAGGAFALWSVTSWRAEAAGAKSQALAFTAAAAVLSFCLLKANTAKLAEMAGALAALGGLAFVAAFVFTRFRLAQGAPAVFALALMTLGLTGHLYAYTLPAQCALLAAAAPLLAVRRLWLTPLLIAPPLAAAAWYAIEANPPSPYGY